MNDKVLSFTGYASPTMAMATQRIIGNRGRVTIDGRGFKEHGKTTRKTFKSRKAYQAWLDRSKDDIDGLAS